MALRTLYRSRVDEGWEADFYPFITNFYRIYQQHPIKIIIISMGGQLISPLYLIGSYTQNLLLPTSFEDGSEIVLQFSNKLSTCPEPSPAQVSRNTDAV